AVGNAGNAAVSNVTVTDPLAPDVAPVLVGGFNSGDTDQDGKLDVGEAWHFTASHTASQADLDNNGNPTSGSGVIFDVATAHGTGAADVSDDASVLVAQKIGRATGRERAETAGAADTVGERESGTIAVGSCEHEGAR